mgnify:CR=1 FL=1
MSNNLMLASGKLSSYRILIAYLNILNKEERDKVLPRAKDLEYVRMLIDEGINRLDEIIKELSENLKDRINGYYAKKVIKDVLGLDVNESEAKRFVAKELASWILEISENLNIIKIKGSWERK